MIRVALVDDQELIRSGFRAIVESTDDLRVVGEATNGAEAIDLCDRVPVDVLVMDVRMPVLDGISATARIRGRHPEIAVLILTTFDVDEYVYRAVKAGATGFLLKDSPRDHFLYAIRVVHAGDALVSPSVTRRLLERFTPDELVPLPELSEKETTVLRHLAEGLSNRELAERLYVSEATVKTHVSNILTKLGLRDRVQAVVLAYETGLVRPGGARPPTDR